MKGIRNEQTEMTEVRGNIKAALTENKDYCKKTNKQARETEEGWPCRTSCKEECNKCVKWS